MPIKQSAKKALRQSKTHAARNLKTKKVIKDLVKASKKLILAKETTAADKVKAAVKAIDKAVNKKILAKNAGARKKSRLMKKLNALGK
jgi:small subunit ribosomal protein S20